MTEKTKPIPGHIDERGPAPDQPATKPGDQKNYKGPAKDKSEKPANADKADNAGKPNFENRIDAGKHVGAFNVRRVMQGDKPYRKGDKREGAVSELARLCRTGALEPSDKKTAEAVKAYNGA